MGSQKKIRENRPFLRFADFFGHINHRKMLKE